MIYKKILFVAALLFPSIFICRAQKIIPEFEQTVFQYFVDSVFQKVYPEIKIIYYKPVVNQRLSLLRQPIGFEDYLKDKDKAQIALLTKELDSIKQLNFSDSIINAPQNELGIFKFPLKKSKIKWKESIIVEVFKRTIVVPGFYVVEIVAMGNSSRTHFFVEIKRQDKVVTRWYMSQYIF